MRLLGILTGAFCKNGRANLERASIWDCSKRSSKELWIDSQSIQQFLLCFLELIENFIQTWCGIKNDFYGGEAGLQFSINSTNDEQRRELFEVIHQLLFLKSFTYAERQKVYVEFPSYCTDYSGCKGVIQTFR